MKLYNSENNSDKDGGNYEEGNLASIICDKEDVEKLKLFFDSVHEYLKTNDFCHMHFRDSFQDWNNSKHIDIEINVDEREK